MASHDSHQPIKVSDRSVVSGFLSCPFFYRFHPPGVRGASLAQGPDSSLVEVHCGSCSGNNHMDEEKVEVKVPEDEVEDGRDK